MTSLSEKDILDALASDRAEAPKELADRLKAQIPEEILTHSDADGDRRRSWYSTPRLAAAAMVILAGGIFLVSRSFLESPTELRNLAEKGGVRLEGAARVGEESLDQVAERGPESRSDSLEKSSVAGGDRGAEYGEVSAERLPLAAEPTRLLGARQEPGTASEASARRDALLKRERPQQEAGQEMRDRMAFLGSQDEARRRAADEPALQVSEPAVTVTAEAPLVDKYNVAAGSSVADTDDLRIAQDNRDIEAHNAEVRQLEGEKNRLEAKLLQAQAFATPAGTASSTTARTEQIRVATMPAAPFRVAAADRVAPSPIGSRPVPPSTGGTREPNGQAFGDMFFESAGVNPFIDTDDDNLSTFGLDVDTASYTVARGYIESGHLPPADAVRVEEFLNYFDYGDRPPEDADFAIHSEGAESPFGEGPDYRLLRFAIVGREIAAADRRPAVLTFLVDVSGSMQRQDRIEAVKHALRMLLGQLGPADRVGLVTYSDSARILLEPTGDLSSIYGAIQRLHAGGSTNLQDGLQLAYELAARHQQSDSINRIILCSDGVANVGDTAAEQILESVRDGIAGGIEISTIGFGLGNYNDILMERLADRGNGNYYYVDSREEAGRVFVENLTGTLETIGADAKLQVEFNPETVSRYRLLGYENRDVADRRFRDDTVDAGEIGAGHRVTALYEIKLHPHVSRRARLATLRLRYLSVRTGQVEEIEEAVRAAALATRWQSSSSAMKLATIVAEFAEVLRSSYWARESSLEAVQRRAQDLDLDPVLRSDPRVSELLGLVGTAALVDRGPSNR